eukprot:5287590-Prymnesium_polylepis.1
MIHRIRYINRQYRQAAANRVGATDNRAERLRVGGAVRGGASHLMSRESIEAIAAAASLPAASR